ncbi:MAG: peroxiredoxin [Alphaproteobacteria bacterium]
MSKVAKTAAKPRAPKPSAAPVPGLKVGDKIPAFSMPVTGGGTISATQLKGKTYVLYFYPKDDTSGCTAEACGFRDDLPQFSKLGVSVIGVSKDSIASHEKFAAKYDLPFPLASDPETSFAAACGVWIEKSMYGRKYMGIDRSTFLVDGKGIVRAVWRKVSVPGHVEAVRAALNDL